MLFKYLFQIADLDMLQISVLNNRLRQVINMFVLNYRFRHERTPD